MKQIPIVLFGDLHFPWHHKNAVSWAFEIVKRYRPKVIVVMGDMYDMFSFSRFAKSANSIGLTPKQEIEEARACAEDFFNALQAITKSWNPKIILIRGNHCIRYKKSILNAAPELDGLVTLDYFWKFKGVKTIYDTRELVRVGDWYFNHGFLTRRGAHVSYFRKNIGTGHTHFGGVWAIHVDGKLLFELNAGYLADHSAVALSYMPTKEASSTLGIGVIDDLGARFISYDNNKKYKHKDD